MKHDTEDANFDLIKNRSVQVKKGGVYMIQATVSVFYNNLVAGPVIAIIIYLS